MAIIMSLCVVICFSIIFYLFNTLKKEKDESGQVILAMNIGLFLLMGLGGILGIIVKTFGIWGNSW